MNQFLLVLITALVTGIVSVTGIWFGSSLTRGNEDWKWRRDHALEAYSTFMQAVDQLRKETDNLYFVDCDTDAWVKQADLLYDKIIELDRATSRVFLLAPRDVINKMDDLTDNLRNGLVKVSRKCPKIDKDEWKTSGLVSAPPQAAFMNAARNDLGVHPPQYSIAEWTRILASEKPWWRFGR
jgi:hypothetical protein